MNSERGYYHPHNQYQAIDAELNSPFMELTHVVEELRQDTVEPLLEYINKRNLDASDEEIHEQIDEICDKYHIPPETKEAAHNLESLLYEVDGAPVATQQELGRHALEVTVDLDSVATDVKSPHLDENALHSDKEIRDYVVDSDRIYRDEAKPAVLISPEIAAELRAQIEDR